MFNQDLTLRMGVYCILHSTIHTYVGWCILHRNFAISQFALESGQSKVTDIARKPLGRGRKRKEQGRLFSS